MANMYSPLLRFFKISYRKLQLGYEATVLGGLPKRAVHCAVKSEQLLKIVISCTVAFFEWGKSFSSLY